MPGCRKSIRRSLSRAGGLALLGALSATMISCGGSSNNGNVTSYGDSMPLGNGSERAFITTNNGVPVALGVEMTAAALNNLPAPPAGQLATEFPLPAPPGMTTLTPFMIVSNFYSPGHPPPGNQTVPHIHPSWFIITNQQRQQITTFTQADAPVAAAEVPTNYVDAGQGAFIPTVGELWINPTEPGYQATPFATTEDEYRFFNGHMIAYALGIANSFLTSQQSASAPISVPQQYPVPGYYPTNYTVTFDTSRNVWDFTISGFVKH